jgi:hypothetical protein
MSQAISELAAGSLIGIEENSVIALYEVAGFNVHGADTATLVRVTAAASVLYRTAGDINGPYSDSALDVYMRAFESNYSLALRSQLVNASIVCATHASPYSETLSRKVFALSYTELGFGANNGVAENTALSRYSTAENRLRDPSVYWWMRSVYPADTTKAYEVRGDTGASFALIKTASPRYAVPAFAISSELTVSDSVNPVTGGYDLTLPDATPDTPTLISPNAEYVDINADITFEWQHNISTGTEQTAADLQYSYEGGAFTTLATISDDAQTYTCPADTLMAGNYRWRARTYNVDDVAGEWSDPAVFVGVGAPTAPSISGLPTASRPVISWQSAAQAGYQFVLLDGEGETLYDTGETASSVKTLALPMYLANGDYTVRLRIINAALLWSNWAETSFTLTVTPPDTPSIAAELIADGARITPGGIDEDAAHVYLLRNGVPVAEITGLAEYDDYAAVGEAEYVVRVVDVNENYADSDPAIITVAVTGAVLAAADDPGGIIRMTQKAAGQPAVTRQKQLIGSGYHYAGREHQVFTFSEFSNEAFSPSYYYTEYGEWAALDALISRRCTVLYRDALGNRFFGVATTSNEAYDENKIAFTLSIQRVDYVEAIEYAEAWA